MPDGRQRKPDAELRWSYYMRSNRIACRWTLALLLTGLLASAGRAAPPEAGPPTAATADQLPPILNRPLESPPEQPPPTGADQSLLTNDFLVPLGFTGPSGILPRESQQNSDFVPIEDRWRIGFPYWDRYGKNFPCGIDYPYKLGHCWDPYNQNVLKGDYPIIGDHTFLELSAILFSDTEARTVPIPAHGFGSSARAGETDFFGRPNQFLNTDYLTLSVDLFHGDTKAFKPVDWRIKFTPVFNFNSLDIMETGVLAPNVQDGTSRNRTWSTVQEYFVETKIADLSPDYDFVSARIGSQFFNSDFRGFIFTDTNRAVRLFGTCFSNRDQFNILYLRPAEKDIDSGLNTLFEDRRQNILIANYYIQDFIWPGYTTQFSIHYDNDLADFRFDNNGFLERPAPIGVAKPHEVDAVYFGWTGDGHINRFNIDHAFYWVVGHDTLNPLANDGQEISACMAALELSYDRDWARFRTSFFYASGDDNANNRHATGFDSIFDDTNFAGGQFSYWNHEAIGLFGVNLKNENSLVPDLRTSKLEGQAQFVNPGLWLFNLGADFDITPKLRSINNINFLWFNHTQTLQTFTFQQQIRDYIGTDISTGLEYRPLLNNNIIMMFGAATLLPGSGFSDIYSRLTGRADAQFQVFAQLTLAY
jgi:hypothetical protein